MRIIIECEHFDYVELVLKELKEGYLSGLIDCNNNWELEK